MADFRLKVFITVAELQSFTKAGEVLYITQPAVSFQIKSLEEEFGVRLFNREQNKVVLTDIGKVLYNYAKEIFKIYEEAKEEISKLTNSLKGKLIIGVTSIIGKYYLPVVIEAFKQRYPDVEILAQISNTEKIIKSLLQNTLDLCIVSEPLSLYGDSFLYLPYIKDNLVLIVPSNHRWVSRRSIPFEELLEEPFIIREEGSGTRDIIEQYLREKGKGLEDLNIIMALGSTEAIKGAVDSGVGVSILSKCAIKIELKIGSIKIVKIEGMEMFQNFIIVYPKKFQKLNSERFFNFIQEFKPC
ncbi:MAG: selenium metabolism-associated LysR family transcriptional regulator [Thermodesulfobacteriota bacterium]|nr:selenium metabolism-associated LysR family transcriptional regulator [Thermodesulfobacteriota bacterium]